MRDVYTDPAARAEWQELGIGVVPAVKNGDQVFAVYHVDQLRVVAGLLPAEDSPPYEQWVLALDRVLLAIERAVRQLPDDRAMSLPTPNRGRDLRELIYNIYHPIGLMADALNTGRFEWSTEDDFAHSRRFEGRGDLAAFCHDAREAWLARAVLVDAGEAEQQVQTDRGPLTNYQLVQAQATHAAQHQRQVAAFLRGLGQEPDVALGPADIAPITLGGAIY